jgi:hypothetical protein
VPATAPLGATRLRVTLKYNALPTSCETFQYGEVEDYTVNITSTVAKATGRDIATQVVSSENRLTYPNPVKDYLFLALDENTVVHSVNVVTLSGATLHYIEKNVRQVNVSEIPSGMYIVSVRTDSGIAHEKFIKE